MMNKYKILIFAALLILISSCRKDWLEVPKYGIYSSEGYIYNEESALELLNGAYANFLGREMVFTWMVIGDCMSNDSEAGGDKTGTDQEALQAYAEFRANVADGSFLDPFWRYHYSGIYRCNAAIDAFSKTTVIDDQFKTRIIAEAKFLRAEFHFRLLRVFGPIPYINELLPVEDYSKLEKKTFAEILHAIQTELEACYDELPGRFSSSFPYKYEAIEDNGRPGKDAARALLIKTLVFESSYNELIGANDPNNLYEGCENKWAKVRELADEMISNSNNYGLILEKDWNSLWRVTGENSNEIIWKINHATTGHIGTNLPGLSFNDNWWSTGTGQVRMQTFRECDSINGVSDNPLLSDGHGWGWNCPTADFESVFERNDPRRKGTIRYDGDTVTLKIAGEYVKALAKPSHTSPTGMNHRKMEMEADEMDEVDWTDGPLDLKVIRYAEVLLWGAEAHLKNGGDPSKALNYVNQVRERARNISSPASDQPANLSSLSIYDIRDERRRELAFENHRFFDLVRWGIAKDELDGFNTRKNNYTIVFEAGKHEYLPIPQFVINESKGLIQQNPNY